MNFCQWSSFSIRLSNSAETYKMASLVKKYNHQKLLGQVYTPEHIVDKILDLIDFQGPQVLGKAILDPSCGDGQFLVRIVDRIIKEAPSEEIEHYLSFVYGWDIDPAAVDACVANLNKLIEPFEISVNWNISVCDALEHGLDSSRNGKNPKFAYIVGNPPYIRIQHLDEDRRRFIQNNFNFCRRGSTDIYIAFIELSLSLISTTGLVGLITPNTFLYTDAADILRQFLRNNFTIRHITNYGTIQVFENATTYSAITILSLSKSTSFIYEEALTSYDSISKKFDTTSLPVTGGWKLSASKDISETGTRLKDICSIHVGLTTLCDKAYFFSINAIDDQFVIANTRLLGKVKMEAGILRPIIKASKYKHHDQQLDEFALFPYREVDGENKIIPESDLRREFPLAYGYLRRIKHILDMRDNGKFNPVSWYAYGRTQGINLPKRKKILFSPMNKYPNFVLNSRDDVLFYSGYCIITDYDPDSMLRQLNSDEMYDYISIASRDFRGGWKAYNKTVLQNFPVRLTLD